MTPGTRWRYTGQHLNKTGRVLGESGRKVFTQVECGCPQCASGRWVAVDETHEWYPDQYRHIARDAVVEVGRLTAKDEGYTQIHDNKANGRKRAKADGFLR